MKPRTTTSNDGKSPAKGKRSIRKCLQRAAGVPDAPLEKPDTPSQAETDFRKRNPHLAALPSHAIRAGWFTMAHILLQPQARVADMGCGEGEITCAMAAMNPQLSFIGIDPDPAKIEAAKSKWSQPNLTFICADIGCGKAIERESMDAIINSFTLHEIYSAAQFDERKVARALDDQMRLLKQEGLMYIRGYALRFSGEYVLMETADQLTGSDDPMTMAEAELLIWFAANARGTGFFLEELEPRFSNTKLFRLPYKWAYEFALRKDDRARMLAEMNKEYSFYSEPDMRKTLRALGARALYTAPHWDDRIVRRSFEGRLRMFDESFRPLGPPPTSFIAVAQKQGKRKSLRLQERRPSQQQPKRLSVTPMRNERNGKIVDVVSRDYNVTEILPYRLTHEGQLNVFIHEAIPRGIVNAVPRNSRDLDGKNWSGHMVEAISVPSNLVDELKPESIEDVEKFARNYLDLKPEKGALFEIGQSFYPAPDFIDDVISTRYLRVRPKAGAIQPKCFIEDIQGFTTTGRIREVSAQSVLDAISVGFIPNGQLEIQIMALYERVGQSVQTWDDSPLVLEESNPEQTFDPVEFARMKASHDSRFKPIKAPPRQLKNMHSLFVDEGIVEGGLSGLASRDLEFVIPQDDATTLNKAVILPLTRQLDQMMVGMELDYMPVTQRHEGNGLTMKAPTINLPRDVTTMEQAKKFISETCKVPEKNVWKLGESYFCHAGITPIRIFPFAVATKGTLGTWIKGPWAFAPLKWVDRTFNNFMWSGDMITMIQMTRARRRLGQLNDAGLRLDLGRAKMDIPPATSMSDLSNITGRGAAAPARADDAAEPSKKLHIK